MLKNHPLIFLEVKKNHLIFFAYKIDDNFDLKLLQTISIPAQGIENCQVTNFELAYKIINENIFLIEKKLNLTFKDLILIIDDFSSTIINCTGYKKLNGSQLVKENITYILNTIKSKIDESENKKIILHIFNSKYFLDKKKIENLPIGLFGNFYSHELSFFLADENNTKNFEQLINKCNLKLKKIISNSHLEGVHMINKNPELDTFFKVEINKNYSRIFYFENSALKFLQDFKFGNELIIKDISKILGFNNEAITNILENFKINELIEDTGFIEKKYFKNKNFRKINKNLIFEIAKARVSEFSEIFIKKNINLSSFLRKNISIYLLVRDIEKIPILEDIYRSQFSNNNDYKVNLIKDSFFKDKSNTAFKLVQYGWKKEAVPVVREKKSVIAKIFDFIFN
ncbi:MAG: hypothetical protein VX087_01340 [Pseudomonadota bacterium]|nr:hypothetical protein [Pseudomonadota bacterium]